jgi:hypothetical protein
MRPSGAGSDEDGSDEDGSDGYDSDGDESDGDGSEAQHAATVVPLSLCGTPLKM